MGGTPVFIERASGSRVWDVDGYVYLDYVCSWGPMILGHAHASVIDAVKAGAEKGTSFGAPTEMENRLARLVVDAFDSIDLVRFVSSGTEAAMSAIRTARAHTGRGKVVKFEGGYHGHADTLLVAAGSGAVTHGVPTSAGVPESFARETLVAKYNDLGSVHACFEAYPDEIACVIVEPVAGNMGVVPPSPGFLEGLRELTYDQGALLVFDEVITGFRLCFGGAQRLFGVVPDLTCLGKIVGGGMPVGAYGGRADVMSNVSPLGPAYQAGTLSGNPVAMAAGIATLEVLKDTEAYESLEGKAARLAAGFASTFAETETPYRINRVGSMMTLFFNGADVTDFGTASASDTQAFADFFHRMMEEGVYLPPSQFEAMFVSTAHDDADIDATIDAARRSLA